MHITAASLLITAPGFTQSGPVTRLSRSNKTFYDLHFIILSSILAVFLWFSESDQFTRFVRIRGQISESSEDVCSIWNNFFNVTVIA